MSTETDAVWPRGAPAVGQRAERTRAVAKRDIELFTEISGDRNPIHYDEALAKQTRFGEIVVQGGITSAMSIAKTKALSARIATRHNI